MFKIDQRVMTRKGPGIISGYKKSTYTNYVLFYYVKLDNLPVDPITNIPNFLEKYHCPLNEATEIK